MLLINWRYRLALLSAGLLGLASVASAARTGPR